MGVRVARLRALLRLARSSAYGPLTVVLVGIVGLFVLAEVF